MNPLAVSPSDFLTLLRVIPASFAVMTPDFIVREASDAYLIVAQKSRQELLGRTLFDVFFAGKANPDLVDFGEKLGASLLEALQTKKTHVLSVQRYDLSASSPPGGMQEHYWSILNVPVLNATGEVMYIIHHVEEKTKERRTQRRIDKMAEETRRQALVYDSILSTTADFNYSFDRQGRFSYINRALLSLLGITLDQALGRNFHDLNYPPELAAKLQAQIEQVFKTGRQLKDETPFTNPEGKWGYYEYIFVPIFDRAGRVESVAGSTRDISAHKRAQVALKASDERLAELNRDLEERVARRTAELEKANRHIQESLEEKEVLLKEIHHRVKNNLQIISSLLRMQSNKTTNAELASILTESQDRIRSMALVHDLLYQSKHLRSIPFHKYLEKLMTQLFSFYDKSQDLNFSVEGEEVSLDLDTAIPCGLIVTELVTNACKHAFPGRRKGRVRVAVERSGNDQAIVTIEDDGVGLSSGRSSHTSSMGLTIVSALTRQLEGNLQVRSELRKGTSYTLTVPLPRQAALETISSGA